MTDPTLARIEDELQAMRSEMATRGDVARLLAAVERIAAAPSFTADEDAPVEPPRDMAASIARGLAQAAAGQVIELDPDEYRPCAEGRGGEAWPE